MNFFFRCCGCISGMNNDAMDAQFSKGALNPEAAESCFIDEVVGSAGIMFLKVVK